MLFAKRPRWLVVVASMLLVWFVHQYLAWKGYLDGLLASPDVGVGVFLCIWLLGLALVSSQYVRWLQKYFYYYKLMWLFEHQLVDKEWLKYDDRDGMTHVFAREGNFFKVVTSARDGRVVRIFRFRYGRVNSEIPELDTYTYASSLSRLGSRMLFDYRATFKNLSTALSAAHRE